MTVLDLNDRDLWYFLLALFCRSFSLFVVLTMRQISNEENQQQNRDTCTRPQQNLAPVALLRLLLAVILLLHVAIMLHTFMPLMCSLPGK